MFELTGMPAANALTTGTALAWQSLNDTSSGALYHGGNVSTLIKNLLTMEAVTTAATGVPGKLMLVDLQGYYPGISMNSATAQTLTGTPTLRYTNGVGVMAFLDITTASGATAHNVSLSYTNQSATAGRALGATVACTASAIVGHITHSGTAANNYGPFLPLTAGDTGIQSVQSLTLSAASLAGVASLVLAKPLATIPLTTASVASGRDFLFNMPSLPAIPDGACLAFLYMSGAATAASTTFQGELNVAWG